MLKKHIKLLATFNTSDTALVVSGYPENSTKGRNHGIAWYTKKTLEPIAKKYGKRFVVLAEKSETGEVISTHAHGNIIVWRVFDTQGIHLYPQILSALGKFSTIKDVYVHSEFGMKGGIWHFGLLIPFLMLIKLASKNITFFSHNVIDDINMLAGHLNLEEGSLVTKILNTGLYIYYWGLALLCQRIVVLDETLAYRLEKFCPKNKIIVTPIPVSSKSNPLSQNQAKKKLGFATTDKVLLYFGFVTWYKGADWLVKEFNQLSALAKKKNVHLVIAGGPSYSLQSQPYYQAYYHKLTEIAAKNPRIHMTGFIKESDIEKYFRAADLVVFPYRGLMGASGCLTHALTHNRPFMMSKMMSPALMNSDAQEALSKTGLSLKEVTFTFSASGLKKIIDQIDNIKITEFSTLFASMRSEKQLVKREYQLLYDNKQWTLGLLPQPVVQLAQFFVSTK